MSNEMDYKILLGTYQQKSFDLFNQVVALEARVSSSNQTIEVLNKRVTDLISELESQKSIVTSLKRAELERIELEKIKESELKLQSQSEEIHFGLIAPPAPQKRKTKKEINSAEASEELDSDRSD